MLAIILGTRPELIKCAPILFEAERRGIPAGIIHTGQHYSRELDGVFFEELGLKAPIAHVHVGSRSAAKQIGVMMERIADVLEEISPSAVMVQGDTNSVLAGALAAYKSGIPVAHLEAGLRSDDWNMPEESNRVLTDRISKWLFCPTEIQKGRLEREGIVHDGVHIVGNTVVDAALHFVERARAESRILERLSLSEDIPYALLTMHRPHNVDDPAVLRKMIDGISNATKDRGLRVIFPIHPRTKNIMDRHSIRLCDHVIAIEPLGYFDLLRLQSGARIVLTDSGGIQEEACILKIPSITLRSTTERPETLSVGASVLCSIEQIDELPTLIDRQMSLARDWQNPFGDGKTAERVLDIIQETLSSV